MTDQSVRRSERFKTIVASAIAFVTVMSAIVAWRAALAAGDASNADMAGLAATLNAEETKSLNSLKAYEHYRAFTTYLRYAILGDLLAEDAANAPEEEAAELDQQRGDAYALAIEIESNFFSSRYLDPETGNYDTYRELGEAEADAEQAKDINPAPHFDRADRLRTKSNSLIAVLVVFAVALWFYTLAEGMRHSFKYVLAFGGTLFALIGVGALFALELLL
jgi:hypothetical protein